MTKRALQLISGMFFLGMAFGSRALEVEPYCLMNNDHIGVNLTGNLKYKSGESLPRHIYIECSRDKCEGFILASAWISTRTIRDLRVGYQSRNLTVMKAGISEFRLDRSTRSFTWIENPYETSGTFQATCPNVKGTAAD